MANMMSVGRRALDRQNSFVVELSGRFLGYQIQTDNSGLFLRLREMDAADEWLPVLSLLDTSKSWRVVYSLVAKLEKHEIKSLAKPVQIGEVFDGPDCIVIS